MKRALNLMPERAYKQELVRRCWKLWSRVLTVVAAVLVVAGVVQWRICQGAANKQATAELIYEPIRKLKAESGRLYLEITNLKKNQLVSLALAEQKPLLGLIGLAAQEVALRNNQIYLQEIKIEHLPFRWEKSDDPMTSFVLRGLGNDSQAISLFAESLRAKGPFINVDLQTASNSVGKANQPIQQLFDIQCTN